MAISSHRLMRDWTVTDVGVLFTKQSATAVAPPREPASAIGWYEHGGANRPPLEQFAAYLAAVKLIVDRELEARLRAATASAHHVGTPAGVIVEAVRMLTLRGGKRFRPALLALAYKACGGEGGVDTVAHAGASLELLQAYLLIHDDWIDDDDFRRGGPSVHAQLRREFATERLAASGAILAGDLASALRLASRRRCRTACRQRVR